MKRFLVLPALLVLCSAAQAQRIVYHLHVKDTTVNYSGKHKTAIAINGQLPGPTLYFTEGDTAEIHVHNHMHHETSVHWHGIMLPNEQDGVPYLTTAPIKPHGEHVYRFVLRQSGTYWYHSHTMLQEQIGMYGALIIHKKDQKKENEEVLLLSDWSNENPHQIERSLHFATDWYAIKKGATQNYGSALAKGYFKTKLTNEWKRMHAMDVSDVYYENFLVNGQSEQHAKTYHKGDVVRLRVINGSASTYFWLTFPAGNITVVASDGMAVSPVEVDRLIVGVSETYDVLVTVQADSTAYPFIATSEDRIGAAVFWLGSGAPFPAYPLPRLQYFEGMKMMNQMMQLNGNMDDMGMKMSLQKMDMNMVMYPEITGEKKALNDEHPEHHEHSGSHGAHRLKTLNYAMLRSPEATTLPIAPLRIFHFELTGNMNRYVWTVNNKTISESDKIKIQAGENIRIILTNNSMMRHPMHLHGHFFRIINGQGAFAPLKNVLDIMPMETDTIEFHASEAYGDWYFHCHILYHMMSGMGKIFNYENTPPNPQITNPKSALRKVYHDDRRFYAGAEIGLESNGSDGQISLANTRWKLQTEWRLGLNSDKGYESESHIGHYLGSKQFALLYTGWDYRYRSNSEAEKNIFGQTNTKDQRGVFCLGLQYTLPWFLLADFRVDHTGNLRFQLSREDIPITARLRLSGMLNSDLEYSIGARYIVTKYISLSTHYDSDMGLGGGMVITY